MFDRLPDPSIPFAESDRARLRADYDHNALESLLTLLPRGVRGVLFEVACTEPDHEAVRLALAEYADNTEDDVSIPAMDSGVVLPPQLEDFSFHDTTAQALLEATVAPARRGVILRLWQQHLAGGFPPACRDAEVDGVPLVLLDADIAGCVVTFLETGALDATRREILQSCATDVERILPQLGPDVKLYFQRLSLLAGLVLERFLDR